MRIVQLTPGSGNFYCENCIRDLSLVYAMGRLGHAVEMVPMYLPIGVPDAPPPAGRVFFGGVNVYLQQKWPVLGRLPRALDGWLNSPRLLRWLSGRSGMVDPVRLGELTLSMLEGPRGRQAKELARLIDYLSASPPPDVVVLSNALLIGLAEPLARALHAPVVCLLQDEDAWLDDLVAPYGEQCWRLIGRQAGAVSAFVAPSDYFAQFMQGRLNLEKSKLHRVYGGVDPRQFAETNSTPPAEPVVGYLSRMCPEFGLDVLIEAMAILRRTPGLANARLRVAGGQTAQDAPFVAGVEKRIAELGLVDAVEFEGSLELLRRREFLASVSLLCVPARKPQAFGLFQLESLACGTPVVLPRQGGFVELSQRLGGTLLHEPGDAASAAETMSQLLLDPPLAGRMGQVGRKIVCEEFTIDRSAAQLADIYQSLAKGMTHASASR